MKFSIFNFQFPTQRGFTLIETLVAITILLFGVLGPMTAATRGITDGLYAGNQLVATHLAQEGLDLLSLQIQNNNRIKDIDGDGDRDNNDFLTGLGNCLTSSPSFPCAVGALDVSESVTFPSCSSVGAGACEIAYHTASRFYKDYVLSLSADFVGPVFRRILTVEILTNTPTDAEVLLKSRVEWKNKATDVTAKIVELYRYAFDQKR